MNHIPEIYRIAIKASVEASAIIMEYYANGFKTTIKSDGSPVTQADLAASKIIFNHLVKTNIPILGEELKKDDFSIRSKWTENWCVDPLDGTRMFVEQNGEFAVNIAHIIKNKAAFGIIASPTERKVIFGGDGFGVFISTFENIDTPNKWKKINPPDSLKNPLTVICSRSYKHGSSYKYIQGLERKFGEMVYLKKGSALKFFDLAEGNAEIYPRFAPTMEWDIAAGQAIIETLGGEVVAVENNKPLTYNKESLYNPKFIVKTKVVVS